MEVLLVGVLGFVVGFVIGIGVGLERKREEEEFEEILREAVAEELREEAKKQEEEKTRILLAEAEWWRAWKENARRLRKVVLSPKAKLVGFVLLSHQVEGWMKWARRAKLQLVPETGLSPEEVEEGLQELEDKQILRGREEAKRLYYVPYEDYLFSPHWQRTRDAFLKIIGWKCQICGRKDVPLDVHHNTYENLGREEFGDLVALCRECHELFHNRFPPHQWT